MSSCCCAINLHEEKSVSQLAEQLDEFHVDNKTEQTILEAVEVLKHYKETLELTPREVMSLFQNCQISDTNTPSEMNDKLASNNRAYVVRKKFFSSYITKKKFESTLFELVYELARSVAGDILHAIVSLIKNFSMVCLECQSMTTTYKEVCFKFFCRDAKSNEILMLIINLDYGAKDHSVSVVRKLINYVRFGLHLSFFGAVIRTSLTEINEETK